MLELMSEEKIRAIALHEARGLEGKAFEYAVWVSIQTAKAVLKDLEIDCIVRVSSCPSIDRCEHCEAWDKDEECCALSDICPTQGAMLVIAEDRVT